MRRLALAVAAAFAALGGGIPAASARTPSAAGCPSPVRDASDLGRLAFVRAGQLELLEVRDCRVRTVVPSGVEGPVRWSADGRYLAFGAGAVVAAGGGKVTYPLGRLAAGWGTGARGWAWSPTGHTLAGVSVSGGVLVGGPGGAARRLLPGGWGATSLAFAADGRTLAVSRSLYPNAPPPYHQEVWLIDLRTGQKREIFHLHKGELAPPWLYGFSLDGRWVIGWEDIQNSSSLAADGLPLIAIPLDGGTAVPLGKGTLVYGDFLSLCSRALAYVLNRGGREVTLGDRIGLARPPRWLPVEPAAVASTAKLSFNSPACSPTATFGLAASVGPATLDEPLGGERRSIWLLGSSGGNWRALEPAAPRGSTDELPMWSKDGRWIAFVRTTWSASRQQGVGRLYLLEIGDEPNARPKLVGPIAGLGSTGNYLGHYGWGGQIAWDGG